MVTDRTLPAGTAPSSAQNTAFVAVQELVKVFDSNKSHYLSANYQEAEVRRDFIDKLFVAFGWDVNHDTQRNPYEQEVKVERGVSAGGQRRADYAFHLAPNFRDPRFFVEAKKPYGDIATAENYFQTIRYGWNSGTPLAVLTDFEQFHVIDCRYKPDLETALHRAVAKFHYSDYGDPDKFAKIYWLFSREAVAAGSLEKRAADLPKLSRKARQRGFLPGAYKPVDESFLEDLDEYRKELARTFKVSNPDLDSEALTEIAQRTLDRLVFLRFLEDKQIEQQPMIAAFGDRGTVWQDFVAASRRLDGVYNGVVFKRHDILDADDFQVDERAFAGICERLAHINSPYDFNAIPLHILGAIYERFLGKVIVATEKRARVEEKPEVRKAGGVYYTPEYIVRYIVANTVGKLIENKTPAQVAEMRFADIACGSGSFLLGVYDLLLRHHGNYYNSLPEAERARAAIRGDCIDREGKLYLSLRAKREILLNNIFGVDIDSQAVEVAQLSLYLKLLEEETTASAQQYLLEFARTARLKKLLPDLGKNIVCGNSLIGWDISNGNLFHAEDERKLNPMNFEDVFPKTMKRGGFDAIVGNPPYVRIQGFPRAQIAYLSRRYRSMVKNCDLYVSFIERGYELLASDGKLGMIVPNKFLRTDYGQGVRRLITTEKALDALVNFGANQVFGATTYTCLLFLSKAKRETFVYAKAEAKSEALVAPLFVTEETAALSDTPWLFVEPAENRILEKISRGTKRLLDLPAHMSRGSSSGEDAAFVVDNRTKIEKGVLRVPLFATDFNRYSFTPTTKWRIVFPYEVTANGFRLLTQDELKARFPGAYAHLKSHQRALENRKQYAEWFAFSAPRNLHLHDRAQIAVPLLANRGIFALIPDDSRGKLCPMASGGFTITLGPGCDLRAEYILGLINSRLLFWRLRQMSNLFRGGWITCTKQYFGELPIAIPDSMRHDKLVAKVEQMLAAKEALADAFMSKDKNLYERKCASLDHQIDRLVYDLYGLTEEEIAIVEKTTEQL
jgi:adenine-specific DNA-methyltransferase